jgi:hypothetical protein
MDRQADDVSTHPKQRGSVLTSVLLVVVSILGLWPQPAAITAAAIIALVITALCFRNVRRWLDRMDWRVGAILLATAIAVATTLIVYAFGVGREPATFFGAIFAGWISGVGLFAVVGVVVAIVSLARPEEESVESRARILFRGQRGRRIDYIVGRIRQIFEQYAEDVANTMTVTEYHAGEGKFLMMSEGRTLIRAYIDDVPSTYRSSVNITDMTPAPQGAPENRLVYLRVGQQTGGEQVFTGSEIDLPFDTTIAPGGTCMIASGIECWVVAEDEENSFAPVRFSQKIRLTVRNYLRGGAVLRLRVSLDGTRTYDEFSLRHGEERVICEAHDIEPNQMVYDVRFVP